VRRDPACPICQELADVRYPLKESRGGGDGWLIYTVGACPRLVALSHSQAFLGPVRTEALQALKSAAKRHARGQYYYIRKASGPHWWAEAVYVPRRRDARTKLTPPLRPSRGGNVSVTT